MGMNSFELIPTEENLIHTLDKDLLKRNKDLVRFYDLILVQEGASSIAIDGRWGSGKTFFVKQSMLLINAKNPMCDMDDEKKASIVYALPFPKKAEDMLPFFKMVQEMYTTALAKTYKTEYTAEVNYEISTRPVNIHNYFEEGSTAGYVAVSKISKQQLYADVMSLSPYVYCGRFEAEGGLNEPMVMYTRDPGMVIEYCVSGEWVKGITWPESEDDFIFAFFVPDTQKILKINLDVKEHAGKKLREYLRSCEASDHMGWSDPAKMFIVERIRKNTVNQIMKLQNGNEEKRVDATASRLSGKLGKLLMPRIGYEKKKNSGGQGGGGGQGGSGGSSRNLTYEFSDFKFKGNDLEIQYCIKMTHSKRDTNIELVIESEGGRIDPISWQRDIRNS